MLSKSIAYVFVGATLVMNAYADDLQSIIPVVPAAQVKANLPPPPSGHPSSSPIGKALNEASQVKMKPGVNELIPVAQNHLNRIVTPYEKPTVTTSSPATTEVRENVIYIGTTQDAPLTMFITEEGSEEQALSLTLIPKRIPPREVFLALDGSAPTKGTYSSKKAEAWETSQPYVATIEQLFRTLALGGTPPGYKLDQSAIGELPACRQSGLNFDFVKGQTVTGNSLVVHIGTAKNVTQQAVEFAEETCGDWDVAAVAAFPNNVLGPGQTTEIYVAKKKNFRQEIKVTRPSLIGG